jgi:hypothetical protein
MNISLFSGIIFFSQSKIVETPHAQHVFIFILFYFFVYKRIYFFNMNY